MISNATHTAFIDAPVRTIDAEVRVYDSGSMSASLLSTYTKNDCLKSLTIERVGGSGFFGFGICHKLNVKLLDVNREKSFTTAQHIRVRFGSGATTMAVMPYCGFRIHECRRDELTNELSITAYDCLYDLGSHVVSEIDFKKVFSSGSYDLGDLANHIAQNYLNVNSILYNNMSINSIALNTKYEIGSDNLLGTETFREVLDWIAQITCSIYYLRHDGYLVFKRLDRDGAAKLTIDKSKYFELKSKTNRRLKKVGVITTLGNNIEASIEESGTMQYIKNNPFCELQTNLADMLNESADAILGITVNQFDCTWRGNYLLEPGDKIALVTKDNGEVYSYLLDDTITYDGSFSQKTSWKYEEPTEADLTNPSTIGEALNQTMATVDKVNKEIDLVVSSVNSFGSEIAQLRLNQDNITASVKETEKEIDELEKQVSAVITSEDVKIEIETAISKLNYEKVTTTTGYTFDADGLKISKSGSEMTTEITEDGMTVYRANQEVLIADNEGVKAEDLHATTYLLIGSNSRIEDYGSNRTGCFWIGKK